MTWFIEIPFSKRSPGHMQSGGVPDIPTDVLNDAGAVRTFLSEQLSATRDGDFCRNVLQRTTSKAAAYIAIEHIISVVGNDHHLFATLAEILAPMAVRDVFDGEWGRTEAEAKQRLLTVMKNLPPKTDSRERDDAAALTAAGWHGSPQGEWTHPRIRRLRARLMPIDHHLVAFAFCVRDGERSTCRPEAWTARVPLSSVADVTLAASGTAYEAERAVGKGGNLALFGLSNPECPDDILSHTIRVGRHRRRWAAMMNANAPADALLSAFRSMDHRFETAVRATVYAAAEAPPTVAEAAAHILVKYRDKLDWSEPSKRGYDEERPGRVGTLASILAGNANCPTDSLRVMFARFPGDIGYEIVQNPNCPPEVLTSFSYTTSDQYAVRVAANPSAPAEVLARLALRTDEVRCAVAGNPSCPPDVLDRLSNDTTAEVRRAVTANPSAPEHVAVAAAL